MTEQANQEQQNNETQFMIQRIYVKDLSFETPNTPAVFQQQWEPELTLDLNTTSTELEAGVFEVVLTGETGLICAMQIPTSKVKNVQKNILIIFLVKLCLKNSSLPKYLPSLPFLP